VVVAPDKERGSSKRRTSQRVITRTPQRTGRSQGRTRRRSCSIARRSESSALLQLDAHVLQAGNHDVPHHFVEELAHAGDVQPAARQSSPRPTADGPSRDVRAGSRRKGASAARLSRRLSRLGATVGSTAGKGGGKSGKGDGMVEPRLLWGIALCAIGCANDTQVMRERAGGESAGAAAGSTRAGFRSSSRLPRSKSCRGSSRLTRRTFIG
jgi:hypothetical protein